MAHLVSSDRGALLAWGRAVGLDPRWLQFKPLRSPHTGERFPAWHWDLWGDRLPPPALDPEVARAGAEPQIGGVQASSSQPGGTT
jgi:hypothetical protein